MAIYNRVDAVLLARLLPGAQGEAQAGIYAHAYRILDVFNQFAYLFAVLLLPLFAHMLKRKENIEKLVKLAFSMLFTVSVIVAFLSTNYSYNIMDLFYDEQIMASAHAFGILMFGFIAISTTYVFGTLMTANGSMKQLNTVAMGGVLISLIINLILIPKLLATGSAIASVSAQFITAIVQMLLAVRILRFRINYPYLGILVIFLMIVLGAFYFTKGLGSEWYIGMLLGFFISVLAAFILKLLNISELFQIIKSRETK